MAPSNIPITRMAIEYTFEEALRLEKVLKAADPFMPPITWVDAKTGRQVLIGSSD